MCVHGKSGYFNVVVQSSISGIFAILIYFHVHSNPLMLTEFCIFLSLFTYADVDDKN